MKLQTGTRLKVAVAGGSIGGLSAGVALRAIGAEVDIYERNAGRMETRGAGIVVQGDLMALLRQHGAPLLPMTSCSVRRYLDPDGGPGTAQAMPQQFTSWEAIYRTLHQMFPNDRYHTGHDVKPLVAGDGGIQPTLDGTTPLACDLLVAADGANSPLRRALLPDVLPRYAGYVAWRGTLDENVASKNLVSFFDDAFTFSEARSGGHMLVYVIPGEGASTKQGQRRLNWVWYIRADQAELDRQLTDNAGHKHHASLPQGAAADDVVAELRQRARAEVHPFMAGLVEATPDPFLQSIIDVVVPRTVFGRTILLGDAAFVVRPHTAGAVAKAAFDARILGSGMRQSPRDVDTALQAIQDAQIEHGNSLVKYGIALGQRWAKARLESRQ
jgi:2-polyprenyl-6-methoxyphenol hydroxylase-like FAD-dependent oxidoreductase